MKYINRFNLEMEKDGCCGNIRKYYLKTLRAVVNKAIKEREASSNTYPFGKGGFEIGKLAEETAKRYLSPQDLELIKNSPQQNPVLELSRRVFLFSYLCFGMSFIDEAMLTKNNINTFGAEEHIVYKRQKTQNAKNAKPIKIPVTPAIKEQLEWFKANTALTGNYLLPVITRDYEGKHNERKCYGCSHYTGMLTGSISNGRRYGTVREKYSCDYDISICPYAAGKV